MFSETRLLAALGFILCLLATAPSHAYEGVGIVRDESPDAGTPAPKLTRPPEVRKFVEAAYPPEALAKGEGAEVGLLIDIDAAGRVTRAEISRSGGAPFDEAARAALLAFEFSPAELDGQPAPVRIEYVYHFEARPPPVPETKPVEVPVNVRGLVLERGTREPLPGAAIFVPQLGLGAESDRDGRFELRGVPSGAVRIQVSEARHQKLETVLDIREGELATFTAYLWPKAVSGYETVVRDERDKPEVSRRTLKKSELTRVPGTFGDPLRVLENMPGMARAPYSLGALLVRGARPEDTSVLIDGVPVPLLYHFGGGPSVVNPSFIERIDFFPGAYGARYGRAIAGIVDVASSPLEPQRIHGSAKVDLLDSGFYVEGPLGADRKYGSVSLAARRSYIDLLLPVMLEAVRQPGQTSLAVAPYYWDYQARYELQLGRDRFQLVGLGSNDLLTVAQAGELASQAFSVDQRQAFNRLGLAWSRPEVAGGWTLSLAPTVGTTVNEVSIGDGFQSETTFWNFNVRGAAKRRWSDSLAVETGVDLGSTLAHVRSETAGTPPPGEASAQPNVSTVDESLTTYAAYVESEWSPLKRWKLIPGLRFEVYDLPRRFSPVVEPRLSTRLALHERLTAKAAWGLFHQAPQPYQLDPRFGNPHLGLLESQQSVLGGELKLTPVLLLDLQGFYNRRSSLVVGSSDFVSRDGARVPERWNNSGHGRAYGLEVLLKHSVTERMYGWISYTLSRSEQWDALRERYAPVGFDQAHLLTLVASYKLAAWQFGTRFRLTTGRPETPVLGSTYDVDSGSYRPVTGEAGSARGATFHQLDLRAERLWTFQTWKLSAYLDIQNVYNAENPELVLWDYRYRESAPLRGLPFLPTLGVTGEF